MIKFFRKIRQQLLNEGKTSKYFRYAIGEILLVMIGILLALQVNNWNENRKNASKEQGYLIGLQNDLENQIERFEVRVPFYTSIIDMSESILNDFTSKESLTDVDSINKKLSFIMYTQTYPDYSTTFNDLNTTGNINLISNDSLRSKIISYYQRSETIKNSIDNNIDNVFYEHIFPPLNATTINLPENFIENYSSVNNDLLIKKLTPYFKNNLKDPAREFDIINAISLRIIITKTNSGITERNLEYAKYILEEIGNELNNITND
ncbi:MAG: hypothetical protein BM563_10330 [Bacteroidetes bacterium MedPE-SWsnd-G1]|nr:MAG: hypothetical protein BM563_10330 [Bacteroidetes bacterium MedPE-SWsnd-G1]